VISPQPGRALVRDAEKVKSNLVTLEDGRVIAKKACSIQIPARFAERGLANISVDSSIIGIYAMVFEDAYAVALDNVYLDIAPTEINKVSVRGDEYYSFVFAPGSVVFKSNTCVRVDAIPFLIYSEMISKGYVPWYLGMEDLANIFNKTKEQTGANIGEFREVTQLIVSLQARDRKDKTRYYRTVPQSAADLVKNPPEFIALRDVAYAPTNTLNRLGGSYFTEGVVAALNNPTERVEHIESIMLA
jgi:hypothetical protein